MILKYSIPKLNKFFFGEERFLTQADQAVRFLPALDIPTSQPKSNLPQQGEIRLLSKNLPSIASVMDTPIYERITFELGENTGDFYTLPNDPVIRVRMHKRLKRTEITKNPDVIELIGLGNFEVMIRGFICNFDGNDYPQDDVDQFDRIFQVGAALPVTNEMLNRKGIHNLVIENIEQERYEAMPNIQPFEISAISDTPIQLKYKSDKALNKQ